MTLQIRGSGWKAHGRSGFNWIQKDCLGVDPRLGESLTEESALAGTNQCCFPPSDGDCQGCWAICVVGYMHSPNAITFGCPCTYMKEYDFVFVEPSEDTHCYYTTGEMIDGCNAISSVVVELADTAGAFVVIFDDGVRRIYANMAQLTSGAIPDGGCPNTPNPCTSGSVIPRHAYIEAPYNCSDITLP